jgi:hypothetical protein
LVDVTRARVALALVLAIAAWLRFSGLDWDRGHGFHPDERNLVEAALRVRFGELRDPGFYAYNGLALFSVRATALAMQAGEPTRAGATRAARLLSALASLAAVALAWPLGRALSGDALGLCFAALLAFDVGLVQAAHFGTTESGLVLCLVATALASARLARGDSHWLATALDCGARIGLGIGLKTSAAAFLALPATALALALRRLGLRRAIAAGAAGAAAAALVFAIVSPHSIAHAGAFLAAMRREQAIASGALPVFYTLQFRGAKPLAFELASLAWLSGPLLPALGLGGGVALALAGRRDARLRGALPLLAFGAAYAAIVASWQAKFVRYLVPLTPVLALGAAFALAALGRRGRAGAVAAAAVVATSLGWALAFTAIHRAPDPRLAASTWLLEHATPGSVVLNERRDVVLPLVDLPPPPLVLRALDGFAEDTDAKLAATADALAAASWVALASDRVHGVVRRHPDLFPYTSALYRLLFDGGLGYEPAARFASPPRLGPLVVRDDAAEETFRVFDHPTVHVFHNSARWTPAAIAAAIRGEADASRVPLPP